MAITALKGRDPFATDRVSVYRNLHNGLRSVRADAGPHRGTIVGHARQIGLTDCVMHVNPKVRARIAQGQGRQVHAWITGNLAVVELSDPQRLTYRPHERPDFFVPDTGHPVWSAPAVLFTDAAYINAIPADREDH